MSLEIAIILMLTYVLSLVFTLKTHKHLYAGGHGDDADEAIGTAGLVDAQVDYWCCSSRRHSSP